MEKNKQQQFIRTVIKIVLTVAAIYVVFRQLDVEQVKCVLVKSNAWWLIPAVILFTGSKVVSSIRLNQYFKNVNLTISEGYNLRLYWVGMFYNLFLPGGIGGDGYKVYLLHKRKDITVKKLVAATLWDRINGLVGLVFLALIIATFVDLPILVAGQRYLIVILTFLVFPGFYLITKLIYPDFTTSYVRTSGYSIVVQVMQLICAYVILLSLGVEQNMLEYQLVFLISSIVAVLPFTIGGVGARELTFILGHEFLGIDKEVAIIFSLVFFLITVLTSFFGVFLKGD